MKPSTSALKHFLLCATATAVVSTSLVGERKNNGRPDEETKHYHQEQTPLLYDPHWDKNYNHEQSESMLQNDLGMHNHHKRNREGVLRSHPVNQTISKSTNSTGTPCHPDLGVLACPKAGEKCRKSSSSNSSDLALGWHCVGDNVLHDQLDGEDALGRILVEHFPPSGQFYDKCTYEFGYKYNYNSTVRFPSAWDRCVCELYDYELPNGESTVYNDVDYCHKVNKYFCANYYNKEADNDPNSYDACLCSVYDGKRISGKSSDFCDELPRRYCEAYYAYGDVVGIARCLCETFGYNDWCDFEPPEGFIPVQPPALAPPTTRNPTRPPTRQPTREPTRKPTREPTRNPTRSPTKRPTLNPTNKPTLNPTNKPKPKATVKPTMFPTRALYTPKPTPDPTLEPTLKPTTANPTKKPTTAEPTNLPTSKPTDLPVDFLVVGETTFRNGPNGPINVNDLDNVITTLRRQPNISRRPGEALRLPAPNNIFRLRTQRHGDDEDDAEEEIHFIGVRQ